MFDRAHRPLSVAKADPCPSGCWYVGASEMSVGGERGEAEGLEGGVMVAHVVDLQGGMGDTVLVGEEAFEFAPAGVAVFVSAYEDMSGEGWKAGGDGPDVEVVDLDYAIGRGHFPANFGGVQVGGCSFEEDVGRVPDELPGAGKDQESYCDADQGVGVTPAREDDNGRGDDCADRAEGVCEHVAHRTLYVQALAPCPEEDDATCQVDDEPERGHEQHRPTEDLCWFPKARVGLDEDPDRDYNERDPVGEGGEDLGPPVAEAFVRGSRPLGEPCGEEGEPEREVVREHVPCVGEQGEAPRQESADDLHCRKARRQDEHHGERAAVTLAGTQAVVMFVMAHDYILS